MNPTASRFYGYVFFEKHRETRQSAEEQASVFYEQWVTFSDLEEMPEEKFPDLQYPDLEIIRLAAGQKGLSVCVFTFGHTAITEIEWEQQDSENPSEFREKADRVFEARLRDMSPCECYLGSSRVCFTQSDDPPADAAKEAAIWKTGSAAQAEISGCGNLFSLGDHQYMLLSSKADIAENFLNRDFPLMEAAFHKLEFEEGELRKLEKQSQDAKTRVQKLLARGWDESEPYFNDIRKYQTDLHRIIIRQTGLRQTLRINIDNLRDIGKKYLSSQNDSLFKPMTKRFDGGATTNMPSTEDDIRLALMFALALLVTLVWLFLPGLRKWKFGWKRFIKRKVGTKK